MKWTKETDYNILSGCKRFRISSARSRGAVIYTLWMCGEFPPLLVGSLAECKESARIHGEQAVEVSPTPTQRRSRSSERR